MLKTNTLHKSAVVADNIAGSNMVSLRDVALEGVVVEILDHPLVLSGPRDVLAEPLRRLTRVVFEVVNSCVVSAVHWALEEEAHSLPGLGPIPIQEHPLDSERAEFLAHLRGDAFPGVD